MDTLGTSPEAQYYLDINKKHRLHVCAIQAPATSVTEDEIGREFTLTGSKTDAEVARDNDKSFCPSQSYIGRLGYRSADGAYLDARGVGKTVGEIHLILSSLSREEFDAMNPLGERDYPSQFTDYVAAVVNQELDRQQDEYLASQNR